jgi:hypothetical protein
VKFLVISPTPSHPTNAGNRSRILAFARALQARGHTIHFMYYAREGLDPAGSVAMSQTWDALTVVHSKYRPAAPPPRGYRIDDWIAPELSIAALELMRAQHVDAVMVNYVMFSRCLMLAPAGTVRVIDTHDRFAGRNEMLASIGRKPDFFWTDAGEELRGLSRADLILAIQGTELGYYESLCPGSCLEVCHVPDWRGHELAATAGAEADAVAPGEAQFEPLRVGLLGSRNQVNSEYFKRFVERWAALPDEQRGQIEIVVAGSICNDPALLGACGYAEVRSLGPVDDLCSFYGAVDVVANPIALGTGQKIKSVEAVSFGKAIVSTAEGFLGMESDEPEHALNDVGDVLDTVLSLSADRARVEALARASRTVFEGYQRKVDAQIDAFIDAIERLQKESRKTVR